MRVIMLLCRPCGTRFDLNVVPALTSLCENVCRPSGLAHISRFTQD